MALQAPRRGLDRGRGLVRAFNAVVAAGGLSWGQLPNPRQGAVHGVAVDRVVVPGASLAQRWATAEPPPGGCPRAQPVDRAVVHGGRSLALAARGGSRAAALFPAPLGGPFAWPRQGPNYLPSRKA